MTTRIIPVILLMCAVSACKPKQIDPPSVGKIWKAVTVKENGTVVFSAGGTANVKPGYERFRLDLTKKDTVVYTDLDGRRLTGSWIFSTDHKRLILQNLTPPPTASAGNLEFYLLTPPTVSGMELTRTNENRKTGNTVNEYQLVPE